MKNNENGRSMVEMLGVLAIIGVLSAGGLAGYSKAMYKYRVNETMNQLTMIVSNIRTTFGSQNKYTGLSGDSAGSIMPGSKAVKYGIVTQDMVIATGDKIQNPFKGSVFITTSDGRLEDDEEAFIIEYNSLPAEACVTMVTSDWGSAAGSGLVGIAADGDCNDSAGAKAGECAAKKGWLNSTDTVNNEAEGSDDLGGKLITASDPKPFTIANAVKACRGTSTDTSANASVALKYY